jgi:hypothetical protein
MRKLSWACQQASMHHALASTAITEGSTSVKSINAAGYRREIRVMDDEIVRGYGEYWLELDVDENKVLVKTFVEGCITRWSFTYPDWKLRGMHIQACKCVT